MNFFPVIFCISIGFLACWGLIPCIRRFIERKTRTDRSGEFHHTHQSVVPRFGGLALAAGFTAVAVSVLMFTPVTVTPITTRLAMILGSLAMFGLGFWDDIKPLGAKVKLLGQFIIASGVFAAGIKIEMFKIPFLEQQLYLGAFSYCATVLWLVTLTNLINLIDGIDGLAGGISFMLMCLLANMGMGVDSMFTTLLSAGTAGAILGFLYYNFPPAKIYMGDGGAYFLGFLIGTLSISNSHKGSVAAALIAPVFALALPIADVTFAIVRRGLKGLPIFRPDRKHIHHRLLDFGLSRERAVLVLYSVSILCLLLAFGVFWLQGRLLPLLLGSLFLIVVIAGRSYGLVKGWMAMAKSISLRHETRYALTLSRWLEMEAERCDSISQLWEDFQFVGAKLGFSELTLKLEDGTRSWRSDENEGMAGELRRTCHEMHGGTAIEFAGDTAVLPDKLFELLTELAAESWQKAARKWQEIHSTPVKFASAASPDTAFYKRKLQRLHEPSIAAGFWNRKGGLAEPAS
jgi:UDP-GlcNAc:undecaprenyl-phosphate/decaprenyl-phosphate GlcNAc-1-phosphate transferase